MERVFSEEFKDNKKRRKKKEKKEKGGPNPSNFPSYATGKERTERRGPGEPF